MYNPSTTLYLILSSATALAQCTAIVQERAIVPIRAPPRPIRPESPGSLGGIGGGGVRPVVGGSAYGQVGGLSDITAAGRGTAPESTTPFLSNANVGNRELIGKAVEAAESVFDLLQNIVSLAGDDDDDDEIAKNWRTSTSSLPKPTRAASTSDGATANYTLSQNNETYAFLSDPRLMSRDVVAEMASANTSAPRLLTNGKLFTSSEYSMYLDDPICFYANIESMYLEAFSSSATGTSAQTPTPTPTQALQRRQSSTDKAAESTSCFAMGPQAICSGGPGSPEWTSSQAASISSLWATELPDQLWSAHFATPATASDGEVTATATSTTSCSGLNGREGHVTKYRELKFRETSVAATTSTNESTSGAARTGGKGGFAYGLVGAVVAGVGLLVL
jgi:hypothetical protein